MGGFLSLKLVPKSTLKSRFWGAKELKNSFPGWQVALISIGLYGLLGLNPLKASFFAFLGTFEGPFSLWGLYPTRLGVNLSPTNSISYQPA